MMILPGADVLTRWRIEVESAAADCGARAFVDVPALIEAVIPNGADTVKALTPTRYGGALLIYAYLYARDVDGLASHVNLAATLTLAAGAFAGDVLLPRETFEPIWRKERAARYGERDTIGALAVIFDVPYMAVAARAVELELIPKAPAERRKGERRAPKGNNHDTC